MPQIRAAPAAQSPSSPAASVVHGEAKPLAGYRQRDRPGRALRELQPAGRLAGPRARHGDVFQTSLKPMPRKRAVELAVREPVGLEEHSAAPAGGPSRDLVLKGGRKPCSVGRGAAQSRRAGVAQLEGRVAGNRREQAREKCREGHVRGPHRSTTVSARFPLRAGAVPSGSVSARAT